MIRKLSLPVAIIVAIGLFSAVPIYAAGSAVQTFTNYLNGQERVITIVWTAGTSGALTPFTTIPINGYIQHITTIPGATAPQDHYDVALTNSDGVDITGGSLVDRNGGSETGAEDVMCIVHNSGGYTVLGTPLVFGPLTVTITGNNVTNSTGTIKIYVQDR
jgi:hypothetical protein